MGLYSGELIIGGGGRIFVSEIWGDNFWESLLSEFYGICGTNTNFFFFLRKTLKLGHFTKFKVTFPVVSTDIETYSISKCKITVIKRGMKEQVTNDDKYQYSLER